MDIEERAKKFLEYFCLEESPASNRLTIKAFQAERDAACADLRVENERLKAIVKIAKRMDYAQQMVIAAANRSQPTKEWELDRNQWMEQLNEALSHKNSFCEDALW